MRERPPSACADTDGKRSARWLSAREHLSVSWVGRSIVDNSVQPPAVLVSQLHDHLASGWRLVDDEGEGGVAAAGERLLAALTCEHRLQPFSPHYFPLSPDPRADGWYSYAREWTQAAVQPRYAPLPPLPGDSIDIATLSAAVREPVKTFFGMRLGVHFKPVEEETLDTEPFALDGLQRWKLVDELLRDTHRAVAQEADGESEVETAHVAARLADFARRGELPDGAFGERTQNMLADDIAGLANAYRAALRNWPQAVADEFTVAVSATTRDGRVLRLVDRLHGLRQRSTSGAAPASFARIATSASHLVDQQNHYKFHALARHWVEHLAWQLACPQGVTSVLLSPKGAVTFAPLAAATAQAELETMLHLRAAALCEPLPFELKTAVKWLQSASNPKPGDDLFADVQSEEAVRKIYEGDGFFAVGERDRDATLARAFPDYAALRAAPRFAELARAWLPRLLKATLASASKKTGDRA